MRDTSIIWMQRIGRLHRKCLQRQARVNVLWWLFAVVIDLVVNIPERGKEKEEVV
ncbi:hypothetical protein K08M4_32050 [Vibrio syngnathi]|uniref:Uncharacterized protein n=1 Tax=Vibrio syngnathi TaxID=3034029 RepID=A0AA34XPR1_9VIBR|nr:hypothetical protein K08M4_32050 [Vibrio syngnathi]